MSLRKSISDRYSQTLNYLLPGRSNTLALQRLTTENQIMKHGLAKMTGKPSMGDMVPPQPDIKYQRSLLGLRSYYDIHNRSVVLRTCTLNIRKEIFRRGGGWIPKFAWKCTKEECEKEYDELPENEMCDCGSELREPDEIEKEAAEKLLFEITDGEGNINTSGQTLWDLLAQCEDDLNIIDDSFLILIKEYTQGIGGGDLTSELIEVVRGSPQIIHIVADGKGQRGGKWWVCPIHREDAKDLGDRLKAKGARCKICGEKLKEVYHIAIQSDHITPMQYYIKGEVIHAMKYSPSMLYGISPIWTLWKIATSLTQQEDYIYASYSKRRMPTGVFNMFSRNPDGIKKWWDKVLQRIKQDRDYIPIAVHDPETGAGKVEFTRFLDSLKEMEYTATRDEMRQRISALYGVTNVFMNDPSMGGGLNNEGLQIVVTNRAIEDGQKTYNDKIFPAILSALQIQDWTYRLLPSEEEDEMAVLQRESQRIANAQAMASLGFAAEIEKIDENEGLFFTFEKIEGFDQQAQPPGEQGGEGVLSFPGAPSWNPTVGEAEQPSGMPQSVHRMLKSEEIQKRFWDKALDALKAVEFKYVYQGLNRKESDSVNKLIYGMFAKPDWDTQKLAEDLREKFGVDRNQADRIVRTEYTAVTNKARELSYVERMEETGGEYRFKWVGPADARTSEICKDIKSIVAREGKGKGVTLKRMKQIVHDVSMKKNGPNWNYRDFVAHIGCRHSIQRQVF